MVRIGRWRVNAAGGHHQAGTCRAEAAHQVAGDFAASFELAMARKDLGLMIDAVDGAPLAAIAAIAARADQLIAAGHGADDMGVLGLPPA